MRSPLYVVVVMFMTTLSFSQEKCETPDQNVNDLNSISITKCSIDDVKKALEEDKTSIKSRKRHRKVRANGAINSANKIQEVKENSLRLEKINVENDILSSLKRVPFHLVEQIPLFTKCKNEPLVSQSKCFEKQMIKHIVNNFSYPKEALNKKIEGKVLVQFTIEKTGKVTSIKKRGPKGTQLLEEEAHRLIASLPKFIPGEHKGNPVNVKYALPIIFKAPTSKQP